MFNSLDLSILMLDCPLVLRDDGRPLANSHRVGAVLVGVKCDLAFLLVLGFFIYFVTVLPFRDLDMAINFNEMKD